VFGGIYRAVVGDPGAPSCEPSEVARLRHRRVPTRRLGDTLIAARPRDGGAVVMETTAAVVWQQMEDWTSERDIDQRLASVFPDVADEARIAARIEILELLGNEDLIERS
jgi:hypothetical protein